MIKESTLGLPLLTEATGGKLGVALASKPTTPLTGGQQASQIAFGDGRRRILHFARRRVGDELGRVS